MRNWRIEMEQTQQKPEQEKIKKREDLRKLKIGNIVHIHKYGRAIFYATSMISHTFLGRTERGGIYELEVMQGYLTPMQDGSVGIGRTHSERIYHEIPFQTEPYETKDLLLRGKGL